MDECIVTIICKCKLITDHFASFKEYLSKIIKEEVSIEKVQDEEEEDTYNITVVVKNPKNNSEQKVAENIMDAIDNFEEKVLNNATNNIEIIPLSGYSTEYIKNDIKTAVHNHRHLCIVDSYENYLRYNKGKILEINHYNLKYGTPEYADAVVYCLEGDIESLKKMTEGKMKEEGEWWSGII